MQLVMDQLAQVKVEWTQCRSAVEATFYAYVIDPVQVAKSCPPVRSDAFGDDRRMRQVFACGHCDKSVHAGCCRRGRWFLAIDDAEDV